MPLRRSLYSCSSRLRDSGVSCRRGDLLLELIIVSAAEIIEEIRKLPPPEKERVLNILQNEHAQFKPGEAQVRFATDADFEKAADGVLRDHAELFRRLAQ